MAEQAIHSLLTRLKEVNDIIGSCSDGTMPFEQANIIARFASVLREELKKTAEEMAREFMSKIEPIVKRAESANRRISVPTLAAYIILATTVWLFIFLIMVIYANFKINSGDLTAFIVLFFVCWILSIIAIIYFTKKYKW